MMTCEFCGRDNVSTRAINVPVLTRDFGSFYLTFAICHRCKNDTRPGLKVRAKLSGLLDNKSATVH